MRKGKKAQALCQPVLLKYFSQQTEINLVFGWKGKEVEESFSHTITLFTRLFTPKAVWSLALTKHVLSNSYINRLQKRAKKKFAVFITLSINLKNLKPQAVRLQSVIKTETGSFRERRDFQSPDNLWIPTGCQHDHMFCLGCSL